MPKQEIRLTKRQIEVLRFVSRHLTNSEIAAQLKLSQKTIELHVGAAMRRLQAKNRHHAVELARKTGFL
jgi:DNA-binding CsgD family transcriptional regulator